MDAPKKSVQELMRPYYSKLFPHGHMYKWLAYGNDGKHAQADAGFFQKREFCFTLDGDIFVRYQSFKNGSDMREAIKNRCPSKIDIGPVYTFNPAERHKFGAGFLPVERELVFDIDLTDYDDVRTCGKEGHICNRCWPLMAVAIQIINRGLREDFGFKHVLWVYSGRRGIHCWVCDPSARKLTDEQRASIANYFAVYKGHENDRVRLALGSGGLHPSVEAAAEFLKSNWIECILPQQRLLEDESMRNSILKLIPDEAVAETIRGEWEGRGKGKSSKNSTEDINVHRWNILQQEVAAKQREFKNKNRQWNRCLDEIIFAFSYPRLDMEVSKKMNHLLKAPFCVHPKTGKVCVPIDPDLAFEFDPDEVPSVQKLLGELDSGDDEGLVPNADGLYYEHTSLAPSIQLFETSFLEGMLRSGREELAAKAKALVDAQRKVEASF